ncbi:MAG: biopolymer transporter ExbD [Pseudomonadales bacterium]|nr:biopolymer transporter ExbD [Pseudomonadales bacterium]
MMGSFVEQRNRKPKYEAKLNLVSLMDIFTILVFFLLLNSGDNQNFEKAEFVKLPDSTASSAMGGDLVLLIGDEVIMLGDDQVATVEEVLKSPEKDIAGLSEALSSYDEKRGERSVYEKTNGRAVTIMGDKSVSYTLLKSVMETCGKNDFRDISLAVNQVANIHSVSTSVSNSVASTIATEGY